MHYSLKFQSTIKHIKNGKITYHISVSLITPYFPHEFVTAPFFPFSFFFFFLLLPSILLLISPPTFLLFLLLSPPFLLSPIQNLNTPIPNYRNHPPPTLNRNWNLNRNRNLHSAAEIFVFSCMIYRHQNFVAIFYSENCCAFYRFQNLRSNFDVVSSKELRLLLCR
ncbi:hypothetical protein Lalb_Chr20g0110401 [Lupinus albus]|uniref:Uncharacterized protein n=1 Tax=Lupinus albus TaxID=3870 RepID=A0A6A4NVZ7_LUPAL|nr:hypothetical protein Lalb_Chr20g0110401 [Lupinus albus]